MKFKDKKSTKTALYLMICCCPNKQPILISFLHEGVIIILIFNINLRANFTCQKIQVLNISNIEILFTQTLRDIILLFHDIAGLGMKLQEWSSFLKTLGKMIMIIH